MGAGRHKGKALEFRTLREACQWAATYRENESVPAKALHVSHYRMH